MMQPSKEVRLLTKSVFLSKLIKSPALLIISLMFFAVGQASAESLISGSLDGTLTFKLVYPDNRLSIRGSGGEVGAVEVDFHNGEGSRVLANVYNINVIAWGPEKFINVSGITIEGNLKIVTGYERDVISVSRSAIRGKLKIVSGNGDDYIGVNGGYIGLSTEIFAGAGDDYLPADRMYFEDTVRLLTGAGADVITLRDSVISKNVNIKTGSGNDTLIGSFVDTRENARMFTGEGEDWVYMIASKFDRNLTVYTGADNDKLEMEENMVSGKVILGGAAGLADVFEYDGLNQFFMGSEILGFETYSPISYESRFCVVNTCPERLN